MKLRVLLSATALGSLSLLAAPAFAQTTINPGDTTADKSATLPTSDKTDANADGTDAKKDIVVTGTRIRNSAYKGADPVRVLTRDDAEANGFSTTTDLLQSNAVTNGTSQINNAYGGYVTNGGPGANTISLRGLGTSRTLVLLNGRRLAPSGSRGAVGSADLNSLPNAMVDRIEVLNSGASSIYGSDAVAGVINVITRKSINGLELNGELNTPQVGAGMQKRVALLFGTSGDNFQINGSLEYYKRDDLTYGDRDFTRCQTQYRNNGTGGGPDSGDLLDPLTGQPKCYGIYGSGDNGLTINTLGTPAFAGRAFRAPGTLSAADPGQTAIFTNTLVALAPGVPATYTGTCNRFRPNPSVTTGLLPGYECVGGGTIGLNVRDTLPTSLYNQALVSGTENYNGFVQGSYKLHALGEAELYGEVLVSRRKSNQLGQRQFTLDYNQGSPLLPANLAGGNFSGACTAASQGTFPTCIIGTPIAARVFANYGNYNNYQTADFVKIGGGLRGNLPFDFHYDAYASKSFSDSRYTTDLILTNRLAQSLDVVASGAGFACRNPIGGCVAAPALTPAVVAGNLPAAFVNYVVAPVTGYTKFRETTFALNIDGPLFTLPGGTAQIALGVERRTQSIDDTPDTNSQTGNLYGFTSSTITRGSDAVNEVYGELELPILHDQFIHDLTVTASGRYTDYRSYGGNTTYKFGGVLSPTSWFSIRGSYGTSFRAPQLFEQYLGATSGFISASSDPCSNLFLETSSATLINNCAADGVPRPTAAVPPSTTSTTGYTANSSVQVNQRGGAASGLKPETSRNINLGGVFTPRFAGGSFSFGVDYFDIKVDNGVSSLSGATILSQCYNGIGGRAANSICQFVSRPALGTLIVTSGYVNISTSVLRGIDYNARFTHDLGPGTILLNAQVTQFLTRYNQTLPTDPIVEESGMVEEPRFTGVFDATYAYKQFSIHYSGEWTQHTSSDAYVTGNDPTYNFNTPDYWLHSLSGTYRADKFAFTFGVRNLLNTSPPQISDGYFSRVGNAPLYSGYDYVGRQFFMNVKTKF